MSKFVAFAVAAAVAVQAQECRTANLEVQCVEVDGNCMTEDENVQKLCNSGLYCGMSGEGVNATMACMTLKADDAACDDNEECESGLCYDDTCQQYSEIAPSAGCFGLGDSCDVEADCVAGACSGGKCVGIATGESCEGNISGYCNKDAFCNSEDNKCTAFKADGEDSTELGQDCLSGYKNADDKCASVVVVQLDGDCDFNNLLCAGDLNCDFATGKCVAKDALPTVDDSKKGEECSNDSDCVTGDNLTNLSCECNAPADPVAAKTCKDVRCSGLVNPSYPSDPTNRVRGDRCMRATRGNGRCNGDIPDFYPASCSGVFCPTCSDANDQQKLEFGVSGNTFCGTKFSDLLSENGPECGSASTLSAGIAAAATFVAVIALN